MNVIMTIPGPTWRNSSMRAELVEASSRAHAHRAVAAPRPTCWACPSTSSARTSSAPARSRSAAPTYRLSRLTDEERARGVVAASAGNHAQGVALAAQALGIAATIFMPWASPLPKLRGDARLRRRGGARGHVDRRDAAAAAAEFAERDRRGAHPPLRPPRHRRRPGHARPRDPRAGSRRRRPSWCRSAAAGCSPASPAAVKARAAATGRTVRIIGVQAENAAAYPASLAAGDPLAGPDVPTIADGIAVGRPGDITFAIIRDTRRRGRHGLRGRHRARAAGAPRARQAGRRARRRGRRRRDPAGTSPARRSRSSRCSPGGNIDPLLHAARRRARARGIRPLPDPAASPLPDRPGQLARVAGAARRRRARTSSRCCTRATVRGCRSARSSSQLSVETRGEEHRAARRSRCSAGGLRARPVVPD